MSFGWMILWIYLIGVVVSWPFLSRWFYRNEEMDHDAVEVGMSIVIGLCVAWGWPLMIPGYWIYEWMIKDGQAKGS